MRYLIMILLIGCTDCSHQQTDAEMEAQATADTIRDAEADTSGNTTWMIHEPAGGCPSGWTPQSGAFHNSDGTADNGCSHGSGNGKARDMLLPGEGVQL